MAIERKILPLVLGLWAGKAEAASVMDMRRLSLGLPAEVTLVGLAFGGRPEIVYRPFSPDGGTHLRVAAGLLAGPELVFVPVNLGWRHVWRREMRLQPSLGAGYEQQLIFAAGQGFHRPAFYMEGGAHYAVTHQTALGLQVAWDLAPFVRPGPGLSLRAGLRWTPPP